MGPGDGVGLARRQDAAGHVKYLGGLVLGHPLGFELAIAFKLLCPFETLPALVAIIVASGLILDYCSHRCVLFQPFALGYVMAKDEETAFLFQLVMVSSR